MQMTITYIQKMDIIAVIVKYLNKYELNINENIIQIAFFNSLIIDYKKYRDVSINKKLIPPIKRNQFYYLITTDYTSLQSINLRKLIIKIISS